MRYFIGYMLTIGLLILLIVFLVNSGGSKNKHLAQPKLLNSYAYTDAEVRVTIDGPIVAASQHEQLQITVSALETSLQHIVGYDGNVVSTQTFSNTQNSYYAFLSALMQANFTRGVTNSLFPSVTGLCPLGDRYNFVIMQDGQTIQNYWATSCGGVATYKGNVPLTLTLFRNQIPNYGRLTSGAQIY